MRTIFWVSISDTAVTPTTRKKLATCLLSEWMEVLGSSTSRVPAGIHSRGDTEDSFLRDHLQRWGWRVGKTTRDGEAPRTPDNKEHHSPQGWGRGEDNCIFQETVWKMPSMPKNLGFHDYNWLDGAHHHITPRKSSTESLILKPYRRIPRFTPLQR